MELKISKIIGQLIICQQSENSIGKVEDVIINHESGKILGILTNQDGKVIANTDVISWEKNITVNEMDDLVPAEEVVAIQKELKFGKITDKVVKTTRGERLGFVKDIIIDFNGLFFTKLYVENKWWIFTIDKRIIPRDFIVKITDKEVIVKDDSATEKFKLKNPFKEKEQILSPGPACLKEQ